jgi:hypothetical protein
MLKWYGYLGLVLITLAQINFFAKIEPFATWYIPIVWYGYILFVDSLVYRVRKRSLIVSYPKEFLFLVVLSVPFWSIFELYNIFTLSWYYLNYVWYVHFVDFTTIMPAVLETFSLYTALEVGKRFDRKANNMKTKRKENPVGNRSGLNFIRLLVVFGAFSILIPILAPRIGFPFIWFGLFLFLDPLNYLMGRTSVVQKVLKNGRGTVLRLFLAGITMGFFWEFWNYQAIPQWIYTLPYLPVNIKIFEMPLFGYLGYLPFALEVFLFYVFFRPYLFRGHNSVLDI